MKFFSRFLLVLSLMGLCLTAQAADPGYYEKAGQNVRVMNNDDGSRTIFKRYPDQQQMKKFTFDPGGKLVSMAVYTTDIYQELRGCLIYDGKKNLLFKVAYGYNKSGRLMKEFMYDAKSEALVSEFRYEYDSAGQRKKDPVCIVYKKGDDPDKRFKFTPSALSSDPFADDKPTKPKGKTLK